MRVHQPAIEKWVARLSGIQVGSRSRRSSGGVSFNDSSFGICAEGFAVFLVAALSVIFLRAMYSPDNNSAALFTSTFSSFPGAP